jgi:hypothetical protein
LPVISTLFSGRLASGATAAGVAFAEEVSVLDALSGALLHAASTPRALQTRMVINWDFMLFIK